ncbi:hypothetical protein HX92_0746 [Mycobacterium tuberculosis]|nr:hypothetical protein MTBK_17520 [Mycobacterium tuberculosis K]AOZ42863.1 hypothetical protein BTB1458_1861 [Mycobacterium tuberculosis]KQL80255.1 hypothetical protein HX92_0746 [Mycobacterium tuberculosis]KRT45121.1 hypothetical protein EI32_1705 [Mycobacterium tuberculosis]KRT47638.1 hypothetical protein HX90_0037 [Mycobacterium tuberculosis]
MPVSWRRRLRTDRNSTVWMCHDVHAVKASRVTMRAGVVRGGARQFKLVG